MGPMGTQERREVQVNGEPTATAAGTVGELVVELGHDPASFGFAIARNGEVVRRGAWAETPIEAGDRIEVVGAVQGG